MPRPQQCETNLHHNFNPTLNSRDSGITEQHKKKLWKSAAHGLTQRYVRPGRKKNLA